MKNWKWLLILFAVIVAGMVLLIADIRKGETYASLEEIRGDITFYPAEILKEVTFDDYMVFFIAEEQERSEELGGGTEDAFCFRIFEIKKNGKFHQTEHSAFAPEGSVIWEEWKELFGDAYLVRFSVHDAATEPLGVKKGWWTYAEEGDHGKWHYSYEILKQNDSGAMVAVKNQ